MTNPSARRRRDMRWTGLLVLAGLAILAGCTRRQYRVAADQNAYDLIAGKSFNPQWALPNWSIYSDPRSRYFDTCDADRPPMPPDDPASHLFMQEVAGMKGWKHWDDSGHRQCLDNPQWRQQLVAYARFTQEDEVLLDLDSSLQLAIIHSPSYQSQLETIYLSALDVSTERFRFEVQFFGGNTTRFDHLGRGVGSGLPSNRGRGLGGAQEPRAGRAEHAGDGHGRLGAEADGDGG